MAPPRLVPVLRHGGRRHAGSASRSTRPRPAAGVANQFAAMPVGAPSRLGAAASAWASSRSPGPVAVAGPRAPGHHARGHHAQPGQPLLAGRGGRRRAGGRGPRRRGRAAPPRSSPAGGRRRRPGGRRRGPGQRPLTGASQKREPSGPSVPSPSPAGAGVHLEPPAPPSASCVGVLAQRLGDRAVGGPPQLDPVADLQAAGLRASCTQPDDLADQTGPRRSSGVRVRSRATVSPGAAGHRPALARGLGDHQLVRPRVAPARRPPRPWRARRGRRRSAPPGRRRRRPPRPPASACRTACPAARKSALTDDVDQVAADRADLESARHVELVGDLGAQLAGSCSQPGARDQRAGQRLAGPHLRRRPGRAAELDQPADQRHLLDQPRRRGRRRRPAASAARCTESAASPSPAHARATPRR